MQAKWWRMAAPLSQCACFRRKPLERQGKSQRNRRFLGVLSLVTFFPQGKKVIKNIFPGRVVAGRVYVHLNLLALRQTAAHNARGRMLSSSTTFGGPPSPLGKANKPPRGGGGIGLIVAHFRRHIAGVRRGSIRTPLPRRCGVHPLHWSRREVGGGAKHVFI